MPSPSDLPPPRIHPSAIIDPEAALSPGVDIGPNCTLRGAVKLGAGVTLIANVYLQGPLEVGEGTTVYPNACIGFPPQDFKFKPGMASAGVKIGAHCIIREGMTIHAASKAPGAGPPTTVGDRCFLMVQSHIGHDAKVGSDVVLCNGALIAGHAEVGDKVTLSGNVAVHQFVRVGRLAMFSGLTAVSRDVPPFCLVGGRNTIHGLNAVGLRRNGVSREEITMLRRAFREAFRARVPRAEQIEILTELGRKSACVLEMAEFCAASKRGMVAAPARMIFDDETLEMDA
jgi:UDP-N-acetylglucosamine acyltransferase